MESVFDSLRDAIAIEIWTRELINNDQHTVLHRLLQIIPLKRWKCDNIFLYSFSVIINIAQVRPTGWQSNDTAEI